MDITRAQAVLTEKARARSSYANDEEWRIKQSQADLDLQDLARHLPDMIALAAASKALLEDIKWIDAKGGYSSEAATDMEAACQPFGIIPAE